MQLSLIVCLFLSVTVLVYGSSSESDEDAPPHDGSVLLGGRGSAGATSRRHPIRGYNRTGTFGHRGMPRVTLPSLSCNQTSGLPLNPYPPYGSSHEVHPTPVNPNSQSGIDVASETNPTSDGTNMVESNIDVRSSS